MSAHRKLILLTITVAAIAIAWFSWPAQPAATIRVDSTGHATLTTKHGTTTLPETVLVEGGTPAIIRFENIDTVAQRLGFFSVPAGSSREYTIEHPGTYSGYCTAHPAKRLTYIVQ